MHSAYGASKACMESLARTWAVELSQQYDVTVNAVNPGPVATDMWECVPCFPQSQDLIWAKRTDVRSL